MVGIIPRVCRCGECLAFPPPAKKHKRGKYGPSIVWRGRWWWHTKEGYYRNEKAGGLLHRVMWETHRSPIPDGYEVHHIDDDGTNNDWDNFELLTRAEHLARHVRSYERKHSKRCKTCGDKFTAAVARAMFCSSSCKTRACNARHGWKPASYTRPCEACQKTFTSKRSDARFCSSACMQRARLARLRDQRSASTRLQH